MRIISGELKGRIINPDKNFSARPTTDMAKESLFNILNNHFNFDEAKVLDLFSGSGSISYEFASRGSKEIIAIESNFQHYSFIKKNIIELNIPSIRVIKGDALLYLKNNKSEFDIIFADPPYDWDKFHLLPEYVFSNNLLSNKGWLVIEHPQSINFSQNPNCFDQRKYGKVHFTFFKNKEV